MEIQKKLIMKGLQIAVDFDGTCVTHDYPLVGKDIGAIPILKRLVEEGNSLILWTMRSGKELNDAIKWFESNGIKLYGIQENPTQSSWTTSPKAYAQLYIDDAALGCPLIINNKLSSRPFVNWNEVEKILFK
jgi:hypothetical protein